MTITPTTTMLTKNTSQLRDRVQQHVAADQVIQGTYWDSENQRGCFIGCLNHSSDPSGAENKYGLPIMVQRIAESIFESLPAAEAKAFFAALPAAVGCDGKDLSRVGWQFLAAELRALPTTSAETHGVIDLVIAGLELLAAGREWPAARAAAARAVAGAVWAAAKAAKAAEAAEAARAAGWAAEAAARATWAADAAARAARASAEAVWAAADAAGVGARVGDAARAVWAARAAALAAVRAAARQRQRDLLLRLIAEAPVREEARS